MKKGFKGKASNFEGDALLNRYPMQIFKRRRNVIFPFYRWCNSSGKGVLNTLKSLNGRSREVVVKRVAIIEF